MRSSNSKEEGRPRRRGIVGTRAALACLALAAFTWSASAALAVTFYKWTDNEGKLHYADVPPKSGYRGEVTRVDVDPGAHGVAAPRNSGPAAEERTAAPAPQKAPDLLQQRRETRDRLEANLAAARERLDLARAALAEGADPQEDEWQFIASQQLGPGPHGPRSNCHPGAGGATVCPGRVPNEAYYQRLDRLQQDVRVAEQAVEDAERAYRQGVD